MYWCLTLVLNITETYKDGLFDGNGDNGVSTRRSRIHICSPNGAVGVALVDLSVYVLVGVDWDEGEFFHKGA